MQPRWIWLLLLIASSLHQGCATGRFQSIYDEAPGDRSSSIAVIVPPTVKVLAVDGHAINHRSLLTFATGQAVFLKPGNHSMSVQYATYVETRTDDHERFESEPALVTVNAQMGQTYRIAYENPWRNPTDERPAFDMLNFRIEPVNQAVVKAPTRSPAAKPAPEPRATNETPNTSTGSSLTSAPVAPPSVTPLDMLKFWWNQADDTQRRLFTDWTE